MGDSKIQYYLLVATSYSDLVYGLCSVFFSLDQDPSTRASLFPYVIFQYVDKL
jgi:hypothetical protein